MYADESAGATYLKRGVVRPGPPAIHYLDPAGLGGRSLQALNQIRPSRLSQLKLHHNIHACEPWRALTKKYVSQNANHCLRLSDILCL
jgi:hypothetical protein